MIQGVPSRPGYRWMSQIFSTAGAAPFYPSPNVKLYFVTISGAGGGGGGGGGGSNVAGAAGGSGGGGGGAGETILRTPVWLDGVASVTVTIGAGGISGPAGTAGADAASHGGNGGASSFGSYLYAGGGVGGYKGIRSATTTRAAGGNGGYGGCVTYTGGYVGHYSSSVEIGVFGRPASSTNPSATGLQLGAHYVSGSGGGCGGGGTAANTYSYGSRCPGFNNNNGAAGTHNTTASRGGCGGGGGTSPFAAGGTGADSPDADVAGAAGSNGSYGSGAGGGSGGSNINTSGGAGGVGGDGYCIVEWEEPII